jgi:hypothetical protein
VQPIASVCEIPVNRLGSRVYHVGCPAGRLSTAAVMRQSSWVLAPNGQVNHVFFAALPDDFRSAELQLPEAILVLLHIIS